MLNDLMLTIMKAKMIVNGAVAIKKSAESFLAPTAIYMPTPKATMSIGTHFLSNAFLLRRSGWDHI